LPSQNKRLKSNSKITKWGLFIILALIWGSSFELMKLGLYQNNDFSKPVLTAYQVAALRLFFAGLIILPLGYKAFKEIPTEKRNYAILSGLLGSFFPAFLFCLAETKLDGSFAGTLNSLTPIFVLLVGFLFFNLKPTQWQVIGILVSFVGSIALFFSKNGQTGDLLYVAYIILATIFYGLNVNMVGKKLKEVPSIKIAALAFSFLTIPSLIILLATHTHQLNFNDPVIIKSISASAILGILGTTIASILFYVLMKRAGGVFASAVTYGIPFVAMFWDIIHNMPTNIWIWLSLLIILSGIFITNRKREQS
jgi:drug/metabolite transporter (DMT)-like permease